ncbi:hypothetical protein OAP32_00470 [Crocinitomicaceae bacterium]|nr:hypothetical protein [Crocinitomicaceae bacterium]
MSKKKKPRNKKYSHTRIADKLEHSSNLKLLANAVIAQAPEQKCELYDHRTGKPLKQNLRATAELMARLEHDWSITLVTCGRFNGEQTTKVWVTDSPYKCKADLLSDHVKQLHEKQMSSYNHQQFVAGVWLAVPHANHELSQEVLDTILADLGVWENYITLIEKKEMDHE